MSEPEKNPYEGMDNQTKAFLMDAARLERMKKREEYLKNRTPEQIEADRLADEKFADIDKVVFGEMTKEEFKKKWNL